MLLATAAILVIADLSIIRYAKVALIDGAIDEYLSRCNRVLLLRAVRMFIFVAWPAVIVTLLYFAAYAWRSVSKLRSDLKHEEQGTC